MHQFLQRLCCMNGGSKTNRNLRKNPLWGFFLYLFNHYFFEKVVQKLLCIQYQEYSLNSSSLKVLTRFAQTEYFFLTERSLSFVRIILVLKGKA